MEKKIDLTQGGIVEKLVKIAIPIMATSFIQIAYNLIDMMWVGKNGSNSVAAVGTAGFYPWLAMAFVIFSKIGGEVKVAQSMGEKNIKEVKSYIKSSIELNVFLSITYTFILILFNKQLIDIFNLGDTEVITMSRQYLVIVAIGMIFYFINPVFTSIFIGLGNSSIPFRINTIGLIVNIILDPLLIFGFGPISALGTNGAGIATITAQIIVSCVFVGYIIKNKIEYFKVKYFRNIELKYFKILYKLGFPVAIQNALFTLISMAMGVIVASFGPVAVAVQKVGSQIESISWMSAEGFASALSTFTGQNYGAYKFDRINKGSKIGLIGALIWGSITTLVLVFFGEIIFRAFINEQDAIIKGIDYLKILGYSQLFMCIEITITGVLKGLGRTYIPSVTSIVLNLARIPMAILLSKPQILGINGIWWSISISSIFKGIILLLIFVGLYKGKKLYKINNNNNNSDINKNLCS
ncbi:MATE family efflux transporter [Intestinibacter sp.]|uniref:MATE family efflux transporter n=1 Tax=Intestinibacter sp. TaxID=1965304 RepID=UPI002A90FC0C|nr:MATE family efflux transporter [Intestinibacter sp.]MDY5211203.1 MATE family efflux transporter [Intestinibacter sp.]